MAGENQDVPNVENQEGSTEQQTETKELSPVEQKAIEMGWRPLDEFEGDPEDFIDAKEFVRRKPLFEKIEHQSKELKAVRKALESFKDHYSKVKEVEFDRAMRRLKEEQKQALVDQDVDRFYAIEEAKDTIQKEKDDFVAKQKESQVQDEPALHPKFQAWVERNPWYGTEKHMRVFADDLGVQLARTMPPDEVLKEVEKRVRAEFPHKFRNPNKDRASSVEEGSSSAKGRSEGGASMSSFEKTLSEDERRVMNQLVRGGHITKEAYLKDLKAIKGN